MAKKLTALFLFCLINIFASATFSQSSNAIYFATDPTVSPDSKTVVFVYESDLWKVPANGGSAVRLTGMDGDESAPSISPDGKWLAFSSNQYSNNDVYLMPLAGGKIRQVTYHQASDEVESWNWHADSLYFRSDRYNRISEYAVSIDGGTPRRIFGHYHNTVHDLVQDPDNHAFYFNESWESFIFPQRKRYKGPFNPDIKWYNTYTRSFKKLTSWEGKDFWPLVDKNGTLYFVSDQANNQYNLYTLKNGNKKQLTHFKTSVRNPSISANGKIIAFEKEYQLFTYDTQTGEEQRIPISISENNTLAQQHSFNTKSHISALDVSPDKKKLAFVSRGELFVSNREGTIVRKINTDAMGRVLEVKWEKDSQTLIFNQTVDGYQNWFSIAADGTKEASRWTNDHRNNRMLALNSDRSQGIYLSGRDELRLLNLKSGKSKTIVKDEFWGYQNDQPRFSPNDKWVVYTAKRDFEDDIFAYNLSSKKTINLTQSGVSENSPFWGPHGNYIYFSSARTHPSYPRGGGDTNLFRMALHPIDKPYKSKKFDKLFNEEDQEKKKDKPDKKSEKKEITININEKGLMERLDQVGPGFGSQRSPYVISRDDKTIVLYVSNHNEGRPALWKTTLQPFKKPETAALKGISYISDIIRAGNDFYALSRGSVYKLDIAHSKADKVAISRTFDRNLQEEFDQMFEEMWANLQENYYTGTFHQTDWKGIRERYKTYLPHVHSRTEFRRLMNDMLGELNSSHIGFSTKGPDEEEFYSTKTLATGIRFEQNHPFMVQTIITDSPAAVSDTNLKPGDQLIAVDGEKVDPHKNREQYFTRPAMPDELSLTFRRNGDSFTTHLHPVSYSEVRSELYDEWEDVNQHKIDEETDKQVAYIHMKNMGSGELEKFLTQMTSETYKRNGLILDLRYNTGGNVHDAVLQFLSQRPYLKWKYRDGAFASQPNFAPAAKPIVLLVNEQSLSDAEVTSAGFKQLNLGTIIGTHTYEWIIFTSGKGLVDGSFYRLPSWGVYTLKGKDLEHTGVAPDISVDNTFKDRLEGKDPQLERAIQFVKDKLSKSDSPGS